MIQYRQFFQGSVWKNLFCSGEILVMASISDSKGGITNLTEKINITSIISTEFSID